MSALIVVSCEMEMKSFPKVQTSIWLFLGGNPTMLFCALSAMYCIRQLCCRDYLEARGIILLVCDQSGQSHNTTNTRKNNQHTKQIQFKYNIYASHNAHKR